LSVSFTIKWARQEWNSWEGGKDNLIGRHQAGMQQVAFYPSLDLIGSRIRNQIRWSKCLKALGKDKDAI